MHSPSSSSAACVRRSRGSNDPRSCHEPPIYTAINAEEAEAALEAFEENWDSQYPTVARSWRHRWDDIIPFLSYPAEIRRAIYTTSAIEALNRKLRKALKTRGHLPSDQAALKLLFLVLTHERKGAVRRTRTWGADQLLSTRPC